MEEPSSDCFSENSLNATRTGMQEHTAMCDGPVDLDGWMIPRALWLTEDAVSREAESTPHFWSMGLCGMPSTTKLDALEAKAIDEIDQFDTMPH
mmetsp:Transcript_66176/g.96898  ORF Transcript_66176/g.96898 Transcript_66176/m.96898 type:complete len:94 (-) Transcript_66176:101-382(-)|eukprot:CAMPEP_0173093218 /NCGR_PEP_ID=MMETSP1102-20130122/29833_1 /TAXON_ID=49646 /ORGANISM="Geminigera sp., Strain Caron Lab Isolate" /LENGTH=93 /DNA_ID=CAMNT_0013981139 /DNA_START=182 /DNA_END=463 /DNA_ORIENTATION=-